MLGNKEDGLRLRPCGSGDGNGNIAADPAVSDVLSLDTLGTNGGRGDAGRDTSVAALKKSMHDEGEKELQRLDEKISHHLSGATGTGTGKLPEKEPGRDKARSDSTRSTPSPPERTNTADTSVGFADPPANRKRRRWKLRLRGYDDDDDTDWWFASTAVPLLAATIAPFANVLSIAALVTFWRMDLRDPDIPGMTVPEFDGTLIQDPRWAYWLNVASLICGFMGNIFLLFNFTNRIRYIVALPVTIILFYVATAILAAITISVNKYIPPERPWETYSQGFWYAVMAACLYMFASMLLMVNMLGYFLGHYPQRFELNDHQRTLILQTMLFFVWLAGGAGVFSSIESAGDGQNWSFVDGLYFCDVTIITVGFGDVVVQTDVGRGIVFPYSVVGIVMLGLVISSISKFAREIGDDNVVRKHTDRIRERTLERVVTDPLELERYDDTKGSRSTALKKTISRPLGGTVIGRIIPRRRTRGLDEQDQETTPGTERIKKHHKKHHQSQHEDPSVNNNTQTPTSTRRKNLKLLMHDRDRFNEMRRIQVATLRFKRWASLSLSVTAFSLLWLVGAIVFWITERTVQDMTYFRALYFCYVSLLTIGYGDLAPKSNAGRPFFVVWSLIAVPTMTLLIGDMSDTVIDQFKRGTFVAADFTILLKRGVWTRYFATRSPLVKWWRRRRQRRTAEQRVRNGMPYGHVDNPDFDSDVEHAGPPTPIERRSTYSRDNTPPATANGDDASSSSTPASSTHLARLATELTADEAAAPAAPSEPATPITSPSQPQPQPQPPSEGHMARRLALAIRKVAADIKLAPNKCYSFEEWAELTRLIRFLGDGPDAPTVTDALTAPSNTRSQDNGNSEAAAATAPAAAAAAAQSQTQPLPADANADLVINWDWLGPDSPLMSSANEPEFILDRLCECLVRFAGRLQERERSGGSGSGSGFGGGDRRAVGGSVEGRDWGEDEEVGVGVGGGRMSPEAEATRLEKELRTEEESGPIGEERQKAKQVAWEG